MPLAGFEPTIPASEWLQTHALDHAATGIGMHCTTFPNPKNSEIQNTSGPKFQIRDREPVEELHFNVKKEGGLQTNL